MFIFIKNHNIMDTMLHINSYKAIFDITPIPCIIVKPDYPLFTIIDVNKQYAEATMSVKENCVGKSLFETFAINPEHEHIQENINLVKAALLEALTTKSTVNQRSIRFDVRIPGTETYIRKYWTGKFTPVLNDQCAVDFILTSPIDVTESHESQLREKKLQLASQIQRDYYQSVFLQVPVGIGIWEGKDFIASMINPSLATFYHKRSESIIGKLFEVFPQTRAFWETIMNQVFETGKPYRGIELPVNLEVEGEVKQSYVNLSIVPYCLPDGKITGVLSVSVDTTREVELRRILEENEFKMKIAVESAKLGIWDYDVRTKKVFSSSHLWIPGFPLEDGNYNIDAFLQQVVPEYRKPVEVALQGLESNFALQIKVVWSDDSLHWIQLTGSTLKDSHNNPLRIVGTTLDITDQKELERRKDELLSTVSHELKTPVTSIKAIAQILEKKFDHLDDLSTTDLLHKLVNQVKRLTNLIHDLLDASLIEGGKLQLNKTHFLFNELVEEVVSEVQRTTAVHHIIFSCKDEIHCFSDKERIRQVVINLLTNAIKYSPKADQVIVTTNLEDQQLLCCVEDFGVGISKEKASKIFERFYRVIDDNHSGFQGIGIGLYISSQIIHRLDGKIWFDSVSNKGTKFCFKVPQF
jgi:two-component system sensor histidine kinase VicK